MVGSAWQELTLLASNCDLEQELDAPRPPRFPGIVPDEPPDAGLCTGKPTMRGGTGKIHWRNRRIIQPVVEVILARMLDPGAQPGSTST